MREAWLGVVVLVVGCQRGALPAAPGVAAAAAVASAAPGARQLRPYELHPVVLVGPVDPVATSDAAARQSSEPSGRVEGRVVDAEGRPVEGATVFWDNGCHQSDDQETITDAHGRFDLEVPCRVTVLGVQRPGWLRVETVTIALAPGHVLRVDVRLDPDVPLDVALTGLESAGEVTSRLRLLAAPFPPPEWVPGVWLWGVGCLEERFDGPRATLRGARADRRRVDVRVFALDDGDDAPDWWGQADVDLRAGEGAVTVAVVPVARANGRVLDPEGRPVADSPVRLLPDGPDLASLDHPNAVWNEGQTTTDLDGTFRLTGPPGAWRVVVTDPTGRLARSDERRRVPSGETALGDLRLAVARSVTVRCAPALQAGGVVSVSGPPGVSLELVDPSTFVVGGLRAGDQANVVVRDTTHGALVILDAERPEEALALQPYGELQVVGRAGVHVSARPDWPVRLPGGANGRVGERVSGGPFEPEEEWRDGEVDGTGDARLTGVVPGRYRLFVGGEPLPGAVDVRPGERTIVSTRAPGPAVPR